MGRCPPEQGRFAPIAWGVGPISTSRPPASSPISRDRHMSWMSLASRCPLLGRVRRISDGPSYAFTRPFRSCSRAASLGTSSPIASHATTAGSRCMTPRTARTSSKTPAASSWYCRCARTTGSSADYRCPPTRKCSGLPGPPRRTRAAHWTSSPPAPSTARVLSTYYRVTFLPGRRRVVSIEQHTHIDALLARCYDLAAEPKLRQLPLSITKELCSTP